MIAIVGDTVSGIIDTGAVEEVQPVCPLSGRVVVHGSDRQSGTDPRGYPDGGPHRIGRPRPGCDRCPGDVAAAEVPEDSYTTQRY